MEVYCIVSIRLLKGFVCLHGADFRLHHPSLLPPLFAKLQGSLQPLVELSCLLALPASYRFPYRTVFALSLFASITFTPYRKNRGRGGGILLPNISLLSIHRLWFHILTPTCTRITFLFTYIPESPTERQ